MAIETGKILFTRDGADANGHGFRYDLVCSQNKGKDQVIVIPVGMDLDGTPVREE